MAGSPLWILMPTYIQKGIFYKTPIKHERNPYLTELAHRHPLASSEKCASVGKKFLFHRRCPQEVLILQKVPRGTRKEVLIL
jgi:hypothetical protein